MTEESPLQSPLDAEPSFTLCPSPSVPKKDIYSTINPVLNQPIPTLDECPLLDSETFYMGSRQKSILGQISGVFDEVPGNGNGVSVEKLVFGCDNDDLVKNVDIVVGFPNEDSRVYNEVEGDFNGVSGFHLAKTDDTVGDSLNGVSGLEVTENCDVNCDQMLKNEDFVANEVSGVHNEIEGDCNGVSGFHLARTDDSVNYFLNRGSGLELTKNCDVHCHEMSKYEDIVVGSPNEVSRVHNEEGDINVVSGLRLGKTDGSVGDFLELNDELKLVDTSEVSGLELITNDENFEGLSDEIGLGFDGEMLKNDSDVNFGRKGEVDVISVVGRANSSLESISKKLGYPLTLELIDDTILIGISGFGRKEGGKGGCIGVAVAGNSNCETQKMKYSRKELEKLRFVNVQGQKNLWQDVYNGFVGNVRKEYGELGCFSQYNQIGSYNCYNGMRNSQGIFGVAAGRGRCTYPNIYVYRRDGTINC